jgi:branched-chain amino acid transport system ATP-binding protein
VSHLCEVIDAHRYYGAVKALQGIDLQLDRGEILGLVGPNGSGKTTLFNCMSGHTKLTRGKVLWRERDITRWPMHQVAGVGLVRTFQQSMRFPSGTVRDNVVTALEIARVAVHGERAVALPDGADGLLDFVGLGHDSDQAAAVLGHGRLRQLGVAMALAARPEVLLLDEPAAGLNAGESQELSNCLRRINQAGVTVVLVDHDMEFVLPLVQRLVVIATGQKLADGHPDEVRRDRAVIDAYLGSRFEEATPDRSANGNT